MSADARRIPCINPRCRRTAAREKHAGADEIVCAKCWKLLPKTLTARYRRLGRHERKLRRLVEKRVAKGTIDRPTVEALQRRMWDRFKSNWHDIRNYFLESTRPEGIETFLQEVGL